MTGMIAANTKHAGDAKKDHRGYAEPFTSEQVDSLLREKWLRLMVKNIRNGKEKMKDWLPFVCPHYSMFKDNHRSQDDIIPEAFTFMTCVDVDDLQLVDKAIESTKRIIGDDSSDWNDKVLRMDYSARKKVHIWVQLPVGLTIAETQKAFCQEIGVPYDESCVTPERFIYLTGIDEEIYRSEKWLQSMTDEELEQRREAYLNRGLDVDGRPLKVENENHTRLTPSEAEDAKDAGIDAAPLPATDRVRFISQGVMKEKGLEASDFLDVGGRHTTVKVFLSGAAQLLKKDEANAILAELMPEHWNDRNIQLLVNDFYKRYTDPNQKLLKYQEALSTQSQRLYGKGAGSAQENSGDAELPQSAMPPLMPVKLPKLVQLLTSNTPAVYKAAVAHAIFPPLATHLCGVRFCYTDNVEHEATLMNCLMAPTGAGKGCIDEPIKRIMADIRHRDQENERREAEWKKDCQKKGANKDKMVRPEGLVIQIIDPDMTKPALVTRMDEAEGHFVYVKLNELDLFEQLKGQTGKQHFQLMCLAFDPGAEYGQTRVGTQSVTARPECRFNWNACTTILKGRRFFSRVLTDGPVSRINFCTIPETEIGAEQPVYGQYDAAFDEALKPYVDNLLSAHGLIDCQQAYRLARKLQQECAEFARLSQSEVYWNLSHRAIVIAWLKACVLYVANGLRWERSIEDFIRWSLNYDLWCKMQFFGTDIEKASNGDDARIGTRGPRNLLELLPDVFTLEDAKRVRLKQGMCAEKTGNMVSTWKKRHYVVQMADGSFHKNTK
ncbi:MAG: hypothetical protein IJ256_10035 [Bacteroidaceae bacterium]|nr:hypothetical protein [Bacteroidaceae bacterium]